VNFFAFVEMSVAKSQRAFPAGTVPLLMLDPDHFVIAVEVMGVGLVVTAVPVELMSMPHLTFGVIEGLISFITTKMSVSITMPSE
jgi:uncharacterized membrane protein YczE